MLPHHRALVGTASPFRRHHVLLGPRASFLAFWKHVENTEAGGTRLRCPLYSGHRNCSSSLFAALKRMALGRENCVSQQLDFWGRRLGVV